MSMVQYHPEGLIYVRTPGATYDDTLVNLNRDFGVDAPPLPEGATERIYEPGLRHCLVLGGSTVVGDVMPWPFGDDLIARVQVGLTAKQNRLHISVHNLDMGTDIKSTITTG
jgi:hypothetical protein